MDSKTIKTLEFPRVIEKLVEYAAFSASAELGRALKPASSLKETLARQACTTEARLLLSSAGGYQRWAARMTSDNWSGWPAAAVSSLKLNCSRSAGRS